MSFSLVLCVKVGQTISAYGHIMFDRGSCNIKCCMCNFAAWLSSYGDKCYRFAVSLVLSGNFAVGWLPLCDVHLGDN